MPTQPVPELVLSQFISVVRENIPEMGTRTGEGDVFGVRFSRDQAGRILGQHSSTHTEQSDDQFRSLEELLSTGMFGEP